MDSQKMITVPEWIQRTYPLDPPPKRATIWRWIRKGKIQPCPERVGRSYRMDPTARYTISHV